jgi:hypothetical protein
MNYKVPLMIGAFILCAGTMVTIIPTMSGAQGKGGIEITAPLPLPVTGTVNVGNFPTFPGTFNVRQAAGAPPLLTRDTVEPVRSIERMLLGNGERCQGRTVAIVPAERRQVIEHVSVLFSLPVEQKVSLAVLRLWTSTGPKVIDVLKPEMLGQLDAVLLPYAVPQVQLAERAQFFAIDHNTRVYVTGGDLVELMWCRDSPLQQAFAEIAVNGFLQ